MRHSPEVDRFIRSVRNAGTIDSDSLNIYEDAARSRNLSHWFDTFEDSSQSAIFIGEAPGIKGACVTGIPFTSRVVLETNDDPWQAFGPDAGYEIPTVESHAQREATATIFWKHVNSLFVDLPRPLTWNAYPYWPHDRQIRANRRPNVSEIRYGSRWLFEIIELFPKARLVAVGNIAKDALLSIGAKHIHIRHPSHGGTSEFIAGLERVATLLAR